MLRSTLKLHFKNTKNRFLLCFVLLYSVIFVFYVWHTSIGYLESAGNLHMNRSRVANTQAMTLSKTRQINPGGLTIEDLDKKIDFFSTISKNELTVGKFLLSEDRKNFKFINFTLNSIYRQYLNAIDDEIIPVQAVYDRGYTLEELSAQESYTRFLDTYDNDLILNPYEVNSANLSMKFLTGPNLMILTCLVVFSVFDIYLTNMKDGSYKILYTLSENRRKVVFSKIIVGIIVGTTAIILSFGVVNLIGYMVGGLGNWHYPIMTKGYPITVFSTSKTYEILPLVQVVFVSLALYLVILTSLMAFTIFISLLANSSSTTISVFFSLIFITVIIHITQSPNSLISLIYPYSFLIIESVWSVKTQLNLWYGFISSAGILISSLILIWYKIFNMDLVDLSEN